MEYLVIYLLVGFLCMKDLDAQDEKLGYPVFPRTFVHNVWLCIAAPIVYLAYKRF